MTEEDQFAHELEYFRHDAEAASQYLYAYLAVHAAAAEDKAILGLINRESLWWRTCLGALQTSFFISLGRVFDRDSRSHSLRRLIQIALDNPHIFSKEALGRRSTVADFVKRAYEPRSADFKRIRTHVDKWRAVYASKYEPIRHKVFAHRDASNTEPLWASTQVRQMQQLLAFLRALHEAFWQLYNNGKKPVLRGGRYSVKGSKPPGKGVHDRIAIEAKRFLNRSASIPKG